jgi:hypothetical protein
MEMVSRRMQAMLIAGLALAAGALVAGPATALAGQYHVYGCRTPSGQPAPADGWSGSVAPGSAFDSYARNTCAEGGALIAALGSATAHGAYVDKAAWSFAAPPGEDVAGAKLLRAGDTAGGASPSFSYSFWLAGSSESNVFEQCLFALGCPVRGNKAQPLSSENRVLVPTANLGSHLYAVASCTGFSGNECPSGTGDANGYAAVVDVYASDIALEQASGPSVTSVGGELASVPSVRGTSDLTFTASDPGSGVYEAVVTVDGQVVASPVLNANGGHCHEVGQSADGRPAFLYVQPCPGSASADVKLDTTRLTEGAHHLVVSVIDAAGNSATVLDREITVANPPQACEPGAPAGVSASAQATLSAGWRHTKRQRLTSRFGRAETIVGQLTGPRGAPIAGATIDLVATPTFQEATLVQMAGVQTAPDGRFSVRLARGISSRTLCLAYRPPGGAASLTRTLVLSVRAGVAMTVSPRATSVGHEIVFHGRLLGGPVPPAGKQLVLEARSPGAAWIEFSVIRTGPRGRFHGSYRFRFPGPADYQFRAVSEPESDYPFAAGSSNVVGVHER